MCQIGDIIVVESYVHNGRNLRRHSFVVIHNESEKIQSLDYDIICNVMSSFKTEEQKKKKLSFTGNFPITHCDSDIEDGNSKDGYIKAEQFYYFNKDKIEYTVIGSMNPDIFNSLLEFIQDLNIQIEEILDNL